MKKLTSEQKIIVAANKIFTQKGYAATTTRDIAKEAGTNLALINYYFGGKENLFRSIVEEKFNKFVDALSPILTQTDVPLEHKLNLLVDNYTNLILDNPDLPLFVLNEIKTNTQFFEGIFVRLRQSIFPIMDEQIKRYGVEIDTFDLIINSISLTLYPIVAKRFLFASGIVDEEHFSEFVEKRRKMITYWVLGKHYLPPESYTPQNDN